MRPNISLVKDNGYGSREFFFKHFLKPINIAGSLCLYDNMDNKFVFIAKESINSNNYPLTRYTPIGVVIIPFNHDLYKTNELAIISLVNMNPNTPNNGGGSISLPFGAKESLEGFTNYRQIATISNNLDSNLVTGQKGFGYVPSTNIFDYFTGSTVSPAKKSGLDTISKYPSIGAGNFGHSPYLENGLRNPYYTCNGNSYFNGLTGNCLSDINGYNNTIKLTNKSTAQSNWKTSNTIEVKTTSGYYPSACCCWRYYTNGTEQGKWYLPSAGEIGYLSSRILEVYLTIERVINVYGPQYATQLGMQDNYWSSTFYSDINARYLYTGIGGIGHMDKTSSNYVRAFYRIKII